MRGSKTRIIFLTVTLFNLGITSADADSCGEATCVPAQGAYISHFTGPDCTGTESYYLPYSGFAYNCQTWDGKGQCGTIKRTVTNRSYRKNGSPCTVNAWPSGNTLENFVTVYRLVCGNGLCEVGETTYCCADCAFCGNGACEASCSESSSTCPSDCGGGGACGDGFCDVLQLECAETCPQDCTAGEACQ